MKVTELRQFAELAVKLGKVAERVHCDEFNSLGSDGETKICNYNLCASVQNDELVLVNFYFGDGDKSQYNGNMFPRYSNGKFQIEYNRKMTDIDITVDDSTEYQRDTAIAICEIFNDFLESKGISIPNDERDDSENQSAIYGSDWYELEDEIKKVITAHDSEIANEVKGIIDTLKHAKEILEGETK